jgi:hypothetical protein
MSGSTDHLDTFEHGAERWPLQAIPASNDRQRHADAAGAMRRKCRSSLRAPEPERADREPYGLSCESQFECFVSLRADDRDLVVIR